MTLGLGVLALLLVAGGSHVEGAQLAALIDLHSGIGDYGATVFLCLHPPGSAGWRAFSSGLTIVPGSLASGVAVQS